MQTWWVALMYFNVSSLLFSSIQVTQEQEQQHPQLICLFPATDLIIFFFAAASHFHPIVANKHSESFCFSFGPMYTQRMESGIEMKF